MTMVSTGPISLAGSATTGGLNQSVNIELGRSATASINMNESAVRTLAGVSSGAISMSNFYGKANVFAFTISSNQTNANLRSLAVAAGWNQSTAVVATVASNIYVYSTSTGNAGLTIDGSWPGGVTLVNNGFIMGKGGDGPLSDPYSYSKAGNPGGPAISLGVSCSITNNSYIAGGGGSGACALSNSMNNPSSGGGAGGGNGGGSGGPGVNPAYTGGAGGGPGAAGADGQIFGPFEGVTKQNVPYTYYQVGGGGGGGRILPGSGGGSGNMNNVNAKGGGAGGGGCGEAGVSTGGSANNAGGGSTNGGQQNGGGGGGWGASGGPGRFYTYSGGSSGGAGGRAVQLNGYTVTWNVTGNRYGAIS